MTASLSLGPADRPLERILALGERVHRTDGQPPFNDQALAAIRSGSAAPLFACTGEDVVGAAVRVGDEFELAVDPERRGQGVGTALAEWMVAESLPGTLAWAHGDLPASRVLAERFGFEPVRTLLQLRAPLAEPRQPSSVTGVRISAFRRGIDEDEWIALNALVFATHPEQGQIGPRDLEQRFAEEWFDAGDFLLARDKRGGLVGYDWVKIAPADPGVGEIYVLGIHPDAAGRGVGRMLLSAGLARMRERGCVEAALYVEAENTAAVSLYRSAGFRDHTVDVQYRLG